MLDFFMLTTWSISRSLWKELYHRHAIFSRVALVLHGEGTRFFLDLQEKGTTSKSNIKRCCNDKIEIGRETWIVNVSYFFSYADNCLLCSIRWTTGRYAAQIPSVERFALSSVLWLLMCSVIIQVCSLFSQGFLNVHTYQNASKNCILDKHISTSFHHVPLHCCIV